jgi:crossover junction endodeoxyribonuclease RuvC
VNVLIGLDPGITGAVAIIDANGARVFDLPVRASGQGIVKRELDAGALAALLDRELPNVGHRRAILERTSARPGQGVASMFSMGVSRGVILGVLAGLAVSCREAPPFAWKKHFRLLGESKAASIALACELFPELAQTRLARVKDHNRAEALLLARYLETF